MLQNFFKISFRNLWKQRGYTFINLAGMAVGMACCFLLLIYVNHEKHYDDFHPKLDRIYRINYHASFSGSEMILRQIPSPMAPLMAQDFPVIEKIARMYQRSISARATNSNQDFEIQSVYFTDSTYQEIFEFPFIKGDPVNALHEPYSVVLTEETANKIFGADEPIGKELFLANQGPFTVKAVLKDLPENTHLDFEMLVPYANIVDVEPLHARQTLDFVLKNNFLASHSMTYVLLKEGASPEDFNSGIRPFLEQYGHEKLIANQDFKLFPVRDIHLGSAAADETSPTVYLKFFLAIGFLILLIACINFINLSTATYLTRTKEVGVRKVLGAGRRNLIWQFIGETMMVSFFAFLISLVAIDLLLPQLSNLVNQELSFSYFSNWQLSLSFFTVFVLSGFLAGAYPAFYASKFKPVEIFQDKIGQGSGTSSGWLKKSLITVQFAVGILLISGTIIILSQLDFWKNQPLGFDKDQVIIVPLQSENLNSLFAPGDSTMRARMNSFEEKLLQHPNIEAVTLGSAMPGLGQVYHPVVTDEITIEDNVFLPANSVDYDYVQTFGIKVLAGRNFGEEYGTDHLSSFIINELAVNELRWDSPEDAIGKKLSYGGKQGNVIGVISNYATGGLQTELAPIILDVSPGKFSSFGIRLRGDDLKGTLALLEQNWQDYFPAKAFEYHFMDEELAESYVNEERLANLGSHFASIAIFLSCFGLFGLISLTVQQRAKEIGIRKVLGSSVSGIVALLSKDFLVLVMVAFAIATPAAWYLMNIWLEDFAYRIELQFWHFALAGIGTLFVAFFTMSFQSIKAALTNPVKSLRSE